MSDKRLATGMEKSLLGDLRRCTFAVGSFDKRFVRCVSDAIRSGQEITLKQAALIPTLHYRYRRQHGKPTPDYDPALDPKAHRKPIKTTPIDVANHWVKDEA